MPDQESRFLTSRLLNNLTELAQMLAECVSTHEVEGLSLSTMPDGSLIIHNPNVAILIE
jgi:hypothetical protein